MILTTRTQVYTKTIQGDKQILECRCQRDDIRHDLEATGYKLLIVAPKDMIIDYDEVSK